MNDGLKAIGCAVINQAISDCKLKSNRKEPNSRADALKFLTTKRLDRFIDEWRLNLDPDYIRKILKDKLGDLS